jgi:ribosomal protein S6
MSAEDAVSAFTDIKNQITATGAIIKNESAPALLNLAYSMDHTVESVRSHYNQAHFAWVIFEANGDQINVLKEEIRHRNDIIRDLLIITKNESPISSDHVASVLNVEDKNAPQEIEEEIVEPSEEVASNTVEESDEENKKLDEAIEKIVE